ncbi:MAG: bis(5'-nucleosyl)-tetraphosphatase (symmetrical) YqeK [Chloroflexi bacterium]|nr:bis(5'-nucleosyl)-tetraphosphatase (symmetrical) YqeK [Chloroflexota bacterium]
MTTIEISDRVVDRIHRRIRRLPPGLQEHCQRVEQIARDLAERHGQDVEAVGLTGLAHDATKHFSGLENLLRMEEYDLPPVTEFERRNPAILHGMVGAELLKREDGLGHPQLYNAVYWHTVGDPGGGDPIAHIVFLADKLDPVKVKRYPWQGELKELAENDLPAAMTMFLTRNVVRMLEKGSAVHPASIEARNTLLLSKTS